MAKPSGGSGLQLNTRKDTNVSATVNSQYEISNKFINKSKYTHIDISIYVYVQHIRRQQDAVLDNFDICIAGG